MCVYTDVNMQTCDCTSNNKYDPPCKSNPRLTFLDIKQLFELKKFDNVKRDRKKIVK